MKVVFFGGGAHRTLPIVRGALAADGMLADGEIVLYDRDVERAEVMARLITQSPELRTCPCRITWKEPLEEVLEGADLVHVVLMPGTLLSYELGHVASRRWGFVSSDNVSLNGAFLALKGGPILMGLAREMEKRCPRAWLLNFVNPSPVLSAAINTYTKVRAAGICSGFVHYMWDLPRLMGRDAFDPALDVDAAGVNHLSFIVRGSWRGKELYRVLGRLLRPGWKPPQPRPGHGGFWHTVRFGLWKMYELYQKFGVVLFSMEFDGMAHLFHEEMFRAYYRKGPRSRAEAEAAVKKARMRRQAEDARFRSLSLQLLEERFWTAHAEATHLGREDHHVTVRFLKGFAGVGPQKIVVSRPNQGAVSGFPDRVVLEYSQILDRGTLKPVDGLTVPLPFQGIVGSLASHQTLLADAIGTGDAKVLYQALQSYPVGQGSVAARRLCLDLLEINREEIPSSLAKVRDFLQVSWPRSGTTKTGSSPEWPILAARNALTRGYTKEDQSKIRPRGRVRSRQCRRRAQSGPKQRFGERVLERDGGPSRRNGGMPGKRGEDPSDRRSRN